MKIRTRYTAFQALIGLGILVFIFSIYDMFLNDSSFFVPVMLTYVVLGVAALVLYIGHKPDLDATEQTIEAAPEERLAPQDEVQEVTPRKEISVNGPHHFRCPFCSNIFALELTHLKKQYELRMDCPFCSNSIRIPRQPKLAAGHPISMEGVAATEQAVFNCTNCGEDLRYSAPGSRPEDRMRVEACPHCGSDNVVPQSAGGPA